MKRLIIIGAGGYAQELLWIVDDLNAVAPQLDFLGFFDFDPGRNPRIEHYGRPVLPDLAPLGDLSDVHFTCGLGSNPRRREAYRKALALGLRPLSLIHPSVIIARYVTIGAGSVIGAGSIVAPYARIGENCAINVHVGVGHNSVLHDHAIISPGARILGNTEIGEAAAIGSNAVIYQGRSVGARAVVGAGSFLVTHLAADRSVFGNPAQSLQRGKPDASQPE